MARSSGEKTTVRSTPISSRDRRSGDRFSLARLALPGVISTSSCSCRGSSSPACTRARTTARSAPNRTSGTSDDTRCEDSVETYSTASTRFVLPCPLAPTNVVTPDPSGTSTCR